MVVAFEQAEGLRALDWMKSDGVAIASTTTLIPAIVTSSKNITYPEDAIAEMKKKADRVIGVPADKIAAELGNPRLVNTILLGVMSNYLPFEIDIWTDVIRKKVKERFVDVNIAAFNRGREIQLSSVEG